MLPEDLETVQHTLLESAASDDLHAFRDAVQSHSLNLHAAAAWYHRHYASGKMGWHMATPLMISSLYGSLDVLQFILSSVSSSGTDVSAACGPDGGTALHYAVAGGSTRVVETVKLLLSHGADVSALDAHGMMPFDVMITSKQWQSKVELECILSNGVVDYRLPSLHNVSDQPSLQAGKEMDAFWKLQSLDDSNDSTAFLHTPAAMSLTSSGTLVSTTSQDLLERAKDYPMDTSLADVKNSIYTSDDFRMFSFKVRPCSRAYSHDWTECPFAHTGENARRRDPRKFHYSCVPCPDFRKGACRFGDACEYAHGIFESWLHPAQYRTRLCKDGVDCVRRVCFFAHTKEELRPLYISSGSAVPSPRGPTSYDVNRPLGPVSPSPFCLAGSLFPPLQPNSLQTSNSMPGAMSPNSLKGSWASPNVPTLHLPSIASLQASRLRTALSARDGSLEDWGRAEGHVKNDPTLVLPQTRFNKHDPVIRLDGISLSPLNIDNAYAMEIASPPSSPLQDHMQTYVSSHLQPPTPPRSRSLLQSQLQSRTQMLSPGGSPLHSASMAYRQAQEDAYVHPSTPPFYNVGSPRDRTCVENEVFTQGNERKPTWPISMVTSSGQYGYSLADWGSPTGKLEWGVQKEDLHRLRRSSSVGVNGRDGTVSMNGRDGPVSMYAASHNMCTVDAECNVSNDESDSVRGFWLDDMQPDEILAWESTNTSTPIHA